ncbi:response regulator [Dasania sp. GY-MA-18]|uniref:Response regulator n=1 Tax=Dasania phycosphaerae TaxID=2950436 RepID=A0A9J6RR60_9GAMM|nr:MULTISPECIES: response regulator [Dasania]MCR8924066.1 response regulator [Dasania sp. GY-MA-18]MCZ0866639.1 response regulator [Dasania phycosphaerae]MCZ0870224.1 response regulator [Dasania phycosphaerae]
MANILIVDDSPIDQKELSSILEKNGHSVISANNGESGVKMASSEKPDLILMDVVMPGLNGFQATRQISKASATAHIPIILVSSKDQETDRQWGLRQGAKSYMVKPVKDKELLSEIAALL